MKRILLIPCFFLVSLGLAAQGDFNRVLSYSSGGFFGLDFTFVKFSGNSDWLENLEQIRMVSFNRINDLLIAENSHYLPLPFKAGDCRYDLTCVKERNIKVNMENRFSNEKVVLSDDIISCAIKSYFSDSLNGLGVVLFALKLDKSRNNDGADISLGRFLLVYFDIETKEILFRAKCSGNPAAIRGFAEYWEHAANSALWNMTAKKLKRKFT